MWVHTGVTCYFVLKIYITGNSIFDFLPFNSGVVCRYGLNQAGQFDCFKGKKKPKTLLFAIVITGHIIGMISVVLKNKLKI